MLHKVLIISCLFIFLGGSAAIAQDFRVQVAAYADSMPPSYFKERGLDRVMVSTDQMSLYRYFIGTYRTREQAEAALEIVIAKGFPNATIIDLEEQRALGGATCPYNRPNRPIFVQDPEQENKVRYLYFEFGSFELSADAQIEVDLMVKALKANPKFSLKIIGQTDGVGTPEANMELATNRARAVRNYMINHNIRTDRITIKVFGEAEAELPNKDEKGEDLPENRKWNRRVILALIDPAEQQN